MRRPLWTAQEIAAAAGGVASADFLATGVSIDTRTLTAGDLFVAIRGEARDGHDYLLKAVENGAAAAVVHREPENAPDRFALVKVPDTTEALNRMGAGARTRSSARIAAITGSVGKTGSKEALARALSRQGATHASIGSYNNHIGVPLSLARMSPGTQFGVFEIGMNHAGEIRALTRMVRPHVALVTTVEPVHLEFFPSVEAIADAKAEIFEGLEPDGIAVLNRDNPHFERLSAAAERVGAAVVGFGKEKRADARLIEADLSAEGSRVSAEIFGSPITYRIAAPGRHWVINSLGVLATAVSLGADLSAAAEALRDVHALKGRGAQHQVKLPDGQAVMLDDSYNASPPSIRAALTILAAQPIAPGGRRIAVLGDMLELGARSPELHRALASDIEETGVDLVFAAGPEMKHLWCALPRSRRGAYAPSAELLASQVIAATRSGDAVLVKGSYGSRMSIVVDAFLALGTGKGATTH